MVTILREAKRAREILLCFFRRAVSSLEQIHAVANFLTLQDSLIAPFRSYPPQQVTTPDGQCGNA